MRCLIAVFHGQSEIGEAQKYEPISLALVYTLWLKKTENQKHANVILSVKLI